MDIRRIAGIGPELCSEVLESLCAKLGIDPYHPESRAEVLGHYKARSGGGQTFCRMLTDKEQDYIYTSATFGIQLDRLVREAVGDDEDNHRATNWLKAMNKAISEAFWCALRLDPTVPPEHNMLSVAADPVSGNLALYSRLEESPSIQVMSMSGSALPADLRAALEKLAGLKV